MNSGAGPLSRCGASPASTFDCDCIHASSMSTRAPESSRMNATSSALRCQFTGRKRAPTFADAIAASTNGMPFGSITATGSAAIAPASIIDCASRSVRASSCAYVTISSPQISAGLSGVDAACELTPEPDTAGEPKRCLQGRGQLDHERRPGIAVATGLDSAAHLLHELGDDVEPETRAVDAGVLAALERREEVDAVGDADSFVDHDQLDPAPCSPGPHRDGAATRRVLDGVLEEVTEHLLERGRIHEDVGALARIERHDVLARHAGGTLECRGKHGREVEPLGPRHCDPDLLSRLLEEARGPLGHRVRARPDDRDSLSPVLGPQIGPAIVERPGPAAQDGELGLQLVLGLGVERGLMLHPGLEL